MTDAKRTTGRGFGYQPEHSGGYHFEVRPLAKGGVALVECYAATDRDGDSAYPTSPMEKARLTAARWEAIRTPVAHDFNQRLQVSKMRVGSWIKGPTMLAPHFGKELILLAWAVEDADLSTIGRMVANWRGLAPEERWWFYTTINAGHRSTGAGKDYGWRAAIKLAFLDEPRDIGLETLRIQPTPEPRAISKDPEADADGPVQGHLFAEPDAPGYGS